MELIYQYTARSGDGAFVAGAIRAGDERRALEHLRSRSLFVTSLEEQSSVRAMAIAPLRLLPVSASARVAFFRSFATLVSAGVPLRRALGVALEECRDGRFAEALRAVLADIESGTALSTAMSRRPGEFSRLFIAMVRAGEAAGALAEVLQRLADLLERDRVIRKRLTSALVYPAIVTVTAVALVLFLIGNTMPAFESMFVEMHVALPLSTRVLIAFGNALSSGSLWPIAVSAVLASFALPAIVRRTPVLLEAWERFKLAVPVIGNVLRKVTIARFARTLGTLLHSGVSIVESLESAQDVIDTAVYRQGVTGIAEALRRGEPLAPALDRELFEPLFCQLVRVGEETGTLDAMLLRLAEYYEVDVETAVATLGSTLEPLLIIVLGAIVGTIVASILIPLYSIIGSIK